MIATAAGYKEKGLTPRWTTLRAHPIQHRLWNSRARFRVVPAGRRSGKTELAKRYLILKALTFTSHPDGWFVLAAPIHKQARDIYWEDVKRLVPDWAIVSISETHMTIRLINGAEISVVGLDQPQRIEGRPLDGIVLDEFADMKPIVWTKHVRPALSTIGRPGWAWFIGVPEGRNHYYKLFTEAMADDTGTWEGFTWKSADLLDPAEIAAAKNDLDELTYQQEYEASFVNFEGRAYYPFDRLIHAKEQLRYNPNLPLIFCFDFNVKPGVAAVVQEQIYRGRMPNVERRDRFTAVIGEVWIPDNSNTPRVCRKLIHDWGDHEGDVLCYGDATGGSRGTAKVSGSDWDLIRANLRPVFGERVKFRYRRKNPKERPRINAVNTRLLTVDGTIRMLVDPKKAPHVVNDFEGVQLVEGGAGEIDGDHDKELTHISDAVGYYLEKRFPVPGHEGVESKEV